MANKFTYKSFLKEVERDIDKAEKKVLRRCMQPLTKKVKSNIDQTFEKKTGNLRRSVTTDISKHTVLIGMSLRIAPHALIMELGSYESGMRKTKGEGPYRKKIRNTGVLPAKGYFLPAFHSTLPEIQKRLSEEWF